MAATTRRQPASFRMLCGGSAILLCLALLSCGNADQEPPAPPEEFLEIEVTQKTEDCYISYAFGGTVQGNHPAGARIIAASRCMHAAALTIESVPGIRDLHFVRGIRTSDGEINIQGNSELQSLDGFNELQRTDVIEIRFNDSLENLHGLEGLEEVRPPNDPFVSPSLTPGAVRIKDNASLTTLDGLDNLERSTSLIITNNTRLRSMEALYGMKSLDYLTIINSPIPQCQIDEFLSRLESEPMEVELNRVGSGECSDE